MIFLGNDVAGCIIHGYTNLGVVNSVSIYWIIIPGCAVFSIIFSH